MITDRQKFYRRKLTQSPVKCLSDPQKKVQLKVLFQYIVNRDLPNIKKFKVQGFAGIYLANEPKTGNTVMHMAAYKNDLELINMFLSDGANINARNKGGITPLMVAAHHGYFELVEILLNKGANLQAEDSFGQNLLWYCFGGTQRHSQIAEFCLSKGATLESNVIGKPIIVRAAEKGNKAAGIFELLLQHGGDVNDMALRTGRTPLIEAARRGSVNVVKRLLTAGAFPDAVDYRQVHSAHEAAYHGHIPVLQLLSGAGAHLDTRSYNGNTPLHLAVSAQQLMSIRFLLQRGANPNSKNNLGLTPKTICKKYNLKQAAKEMKKAERQHNALKERKFAVEVYDWIQNNQNELATSVAAHTQPRGTINRSDLLSVAEAANMPLALETREQFVDLMDPNKTGSVNCGELIRGDRILPKPFMKAAYPADGVAHGKHRQKGKNKNKQNKKPKLKLPKTVKLGICCTEEETNSTQFADSQFILKHIFPGEKTLFARRTHQPSTVFSDDSIWMMSGIKMEFAHINDLCHDGDWDSVVRACSKGFDVNQCDAFFKTPLMYAAIAGRWDMVQLLLAYGANLSAVDNFGWTALHHACRAGNSVVAEELIRNNSNLNSHTTAGGTPLMKAIESNNLDCVLCCVVNGANLRAKTVCGLSVKDYAKSLGNYQIYRALFRFCKAYRGGRYLQKSLARVDPNTKFAFGYPTLTFEYGKDIRGAFRRPQLLKKQTLMKNVLRSKIPVRAIKPKASKNPSGLVFSGQPELPRDLDLEVDSKSEKPPPRIPVSNTGRPLPVSETPLSANPQGNQVIPAASVGQKERKSQVEQSSKNTKTDRPRSDKNQQERGIDLKSSTDSNKPSTGNVNKESADSKLEAKRQQARIPLASAGKKFEELRQRTANHTSHAPIENNTPKSHFFHELKTFGRGKQTQALEARTPMERNAWLFKNYVDIYRGPDLTFYAPAPEDWYPPSREEMIKRYHLHPGIFDRAIDPKLDEDPLQKYVHKVQAKLKAEQDAKQNIQVLYGPQGPEKNQPKRFSVTEELQRLRRLHPADGPSHQDTPQLSLINNFLDVVKKQTGKVSGTLDLTQRRKVTGTEMDTLKSANLAIQERVSTEKIKAK